MGRLIALVLILSGLCWPQTPQKPREPAKTPGASAAVVDAVPEALRDVTVAKGADGSWKCKHSTGKPCTESDVQSMQTRVNASRSNIKNNVAADTTASPAAPPAGTSGSKGPKGYPGVKVILLVTADGTLQCKVSDTGKPCSDADMAETASLAAQKPAMKTP
jgi:hypothetical protein